MHQILNDVLEIHMLEIVSHERCIGDKVFKLEFQQFSGGLALVEQIQLMHLLKHLIFNCVAPYYFNGVAPFAADPPQLEELSRIEEGTENLLLKHDWREVQ